MKNFPIVKSRRLRSTPYTDRIESHGVSSYTVYNHMLLPASFKSLESDYEHLKKFVQVWDVAAERQVEISGKDSAKLVQLMTCRDLSKSKVGKCYYAPLIDDDGLLVNDPIINKLAEDRWWLSIADSDVIFFAKGLAAGNKFDVEIHEPNVNILAVQGPLSDDLMAKLFGEEIRQLKFFNFKYYEFKKKKYFIARSGWSKQSGFEIYVENNLAGQDLYDYLFEYGKEFNVKAGCPNLIERIESALLSYGNDFDNRDNPFEANFDKFVNLDSEINFLGKEKLKKLKQEGFDPRSDEYYTEINQRIRKRFPEEFEEEKTSSVNRVAPADNTASRNSNKGRRTVKLSPSQIAIAKKLNVPLEEYAKYVKE